MVNLSDFSCTVSILFLVDNQGEAIKLEFYIFFNIKH